MFFLRILSFVISSVFIVSAFPQTSFPAMPHPAGTQYHSYPAAVSPSGDDDPANAKPIGVGTVATGANTVRLEIEVGYMAPVDLYFAIYAPGPLKVNDLFLLNTNFAFTPFSQSGLVPWKLNVTHVDEAIFGSLSAADLPKGTYTLYLLALPAGTSLALMNDFDLWSTILTVKPEHKFIAAGGSHSLAVTCDGDVYAWGLNQDEECGLKQNDALMVTVPLLLETLPAGAVEVVGGNIHSMSLMSDGTVYAWGNNVVGELGVGSKDSSYMPLQVHGPYGEGYLTGITRLAAGDVHSLAVKDDGTLWAWGDNKYGKLGIGTYDEHHTVPYQVRGPDNAGFLTDVVDAAAGDNHSLALRRDGTVYACGYNLSGQLGSNDLNYYRSPHQVHGPVSGDEPYLTGIKQVAAGANFSLALKSDGTLWSWGEGGRGQLGLHSNNDHTVPYQVHGPGNVGFLTDVVDIAAGDHHSLALKSDGTVWAWGEGGSGQLGVHSDNDHTVPYQVHGPGNVGFLCGIIGVAAGDDFSLALKDDGTVWSWGECEFGQLGLNTYKDHTDCDHTVPYQVHGPDNVGFLTGIGPTCSP